MRSRLGDDAGRQRPEEELSDHTSRLGDDAGRPRPEEKLSHQSRVTSRL